MYFFTFHYCAAGKKTVSESDKSTQIHFKLA